MILLRHEKAPAWPWKLLDGKPLVEPRSAQSHARGLPFLDRQLCCRCSSVLSTIFADRSFLPDRPLDEGARMTDDDHVFLYLH